MKVGTLMSVVLVSQLHAENVFSQNEVISVSMKNVTVGQVLDQIEKNSDYTFIFTDKTVDTKRKVSIDLKGKSLNEAMSLLFSGTGIEYKIVSNQVILSKSTSTQASQQARLVKGVVVDANGEPVIGANVVEKGTTNGTITDMEGRFTISVARNAVLEVSYIGFKNQQVTANSDNLNITLREDSEQLDEVVVIGYGTARKGDLTGPISSVTGSALTERSTQQLSTAMQGQISGVQVTRSSGAPGSSASIQVRGVTTLSTNEPLVIIDGVPGSLNDVIASDVETMSVLKDAASASIYGSRAAAGVILITTKRAKENRL